MQTYFLNKTLFFKLVFRICAAILPLVGVLFVNHLLAIDDAILLLKMLTLVIPCSYFVRAGLDVILVKHYQEHGFTLTRLVFDLRFCTLIVFGASTFICSFFYIFQILGSSLYVVATFFFYCMFYTLTQIQSAIILSQGSFYKGAIVSLVIPNLYFLLFIASSYIGQSLSTSQVILVPLIFTFISSITGLLILLNRAKKRLSKFVPSIISSWNSLIRNYSALIIIIIPFFSHLYYSAPAAFINDIPEKEIAFLNTLRFSMLMAILNSFVTMSNYKNVANASNMAKKKEAFLGQEYWNIRTYVIILNALLATFLMILVITEIPEKIGLPIASIPITAIVILSHYLFNIYPLRDLLLQFLIDRRAYVFFITSLWLLVIICGLILQRDVFFVVMGMLCISLGSTYFINKLLRSFKAS